MQFRIPDEEMVRVGGDRGLSEEMTATQAIAAFQEQEPALGYQIVIARKVKASEILRGYIPR